MLTFSQIAADVHVSVRTVSRWASPKTPAYRRLKVRRVGHRTVQVRESVWQRFKEAMEQ